MNCGRALIVTTPGDVDLEPAAKVDRGGVQVRFRHGCPKVELVSRRTGLEAAKRISCQMNRENATPGGCGAVDRARPTELVATGLTRCKADQSENVPHGNLRANGLEIDTWQKRSSLRRCPQGSLPARSRTGHREEEPVGRFRTSTFNPSIVAATPCCNTVYALTPRNQPTNSAEERER